MCTEESNPWFIATLLMPIQRVIHAGLPWGTSPTPRCWVPLPWPPSQVDRCPEGTSHPLLLSLLGLAGALYTSELKETSRRRTSWWPQHQSHPCAPHLAWDRGQRGSRLTFLRAFLLQQHPSGIPKLSFLTTHICGCVYEKNKQMSGGVHIEHGEGEGAGGDEGKVGMEPHHPGWQREWELQHLPVGSVASSCTSDELMLRGNAHGSVLEGLENKHEQLCTLALKAHPFLSRASYTSRFSLIL